jgi:hypothetical protein
MTRFFTSAFNFPGLAWGLVLLAIAIGLVFGAIWLAGYRPPLFKKPWLWGVAGVSAFLTWTAIAFVQIPLQTWTGQALTAIWSQSTLIRWLYLAAIPSILLSGIVQEAFKLVPVITYWKRFHIADPKECLIVGAVAGAGFGVFEAIWVHNTIFAAGWTWQTVETNGYLALLGFWERFFTVGFHIAASAIAAYGLARRNGWQFYLIAALLHGAANYSVVLLQTRLLTSVQVEIYIAVFAGAVTAAALWLRWRRQTPSPVPGSTASPAASGTSPPEPGE